MLPLRESSPRPTIAADTLRREPGASLLTGFLMLGELIEFGTTEKIFTAPSEKLTEDYVTGRFG